MLITRYTNFTCLVCGSAAVLSSTKYRAYHKKSIVCGSGLNTGGIIPITQVRMAVMLVLVSGIKNHER
jgi:transcription elongation factor Elf1